MLCLVLHCHTDPESNTSFRVQKPQCHAKVQSPCCRQTRRCQSPTPLSSSKAPRRRQGPKSNAAVKVKSFISAFSSNSISVQRPHAAVKILILIHSQASFKLHVVVKCQSIPHTRRTHPMCIVPRRRQDADSMLPSKFIIICFFSRFDELCHVCRDHILNSLEENICCFSENLQNMLCFVS